VTQGIEVRTQRIWLSDDGIVHAKLKPHIEVDRADAEEAVRAIGSLCNGTKRPVFVDMSEIKFMSRDARTYFAGAETARVEAAAALLIRSPLTKAIGNFFLGLNKPLFPTRLFTSQAEALAWLLGFVP
jgi:hypothetical protein